jgi:hypothetical protein
MNTEFKSKEILRLFDENIYPHIIGDLQILDTIQPETHVVCCTVPTAMLLLGSLDFIGYLLRQTASLDDTEGNIRSVLENRKYFPPVYGPEVIRTLIAFYRGGIMHSFYPRQTIKDIYGIHKSQNAILLETISIEGYTILSLNINVISSDFKNFVHTLYAEIKSTSDTQLLDNIYNSFKRIYPKSLTTMPTTTNLTTIPYGVLHKK